MPTITESAVRALATPESFLRGKEYYEQDAISNAPIQGNLLTADCAGTSAPFYRVRVELDDAGIRSADCTCPYEYGGFCKHIVALLLHFSHDPKEFATRQAPAEMLAELDRDDLLALVTKLVERDPTLYDFVQAALAKPARAGKSRRKKPDPDVYRRRIRQVLHSLDGMRMSEAYWHVGELASELRGFVETAREFLDHGDADTALAILLTLLEEVGEGIEYIDDSDGQLGGLANELGLPLAEAILSLELSEVERQKLVQRLEELDSQLGDYGIETALPVALRAARYGWNKAPDDETAEDEEDERAEDWQDDGYDDEADEYLTFSAPLGELVEAKLNVLERQGKVDEYLAMCRQEGRDLRYTLKLCELGRVEEAIKFAAGHLKDAEEALELARKLRELQRTDEAIEIARRGLKLQGSKARLGAWLGPIEESRGEAERAYAAWRAAFAEQPTLDTYETLKRLAGRAWKERRPGIMAVLKKSGDGQTLAEVYLSEEEWDEAVEVASKRGVWYAVVATVADGVIEHRPEWVIRASVREAEELIARTQSKYYAHAAEWLARAKKAYARLGRTDDWRAYLEGLKAKYSRRPALQEQLRRL